MFFTLKNCLIEGGLPRLNPLLIRRRRVGEPDPILFASEQDVPLFRRHAPFRGNPDSEGPKDPGIKRIPRPEVNHWAFRRRGRRVLFAAINS